MEWVLILQVAFNYSWGGVIQVEFKTEQLCKDGGQKIASTIANVNRVHRHQQRGPNAIHLRFPEDRQRRIRQL